MPTLLFYAAFAIGEAACIVYAINIFHSYPWRVRWTERATLVALAVLGVVSAELTRRYWMTPVSEWPPALVAFAAGCCLMALVVLPAATFARARRMRRSGSVEGERRDSLLQDPPESYVGGGRHAWMLRLPGNTSRNLESRDWSVPIAALPEELDGLSILHLTDLHFSRAYSRRYFEAVFAAAADMPADMVCVTGDLIDDPECIEWIEPLLSGLRGPFGRFAILGNHDHHHDVDAIAAAIAAAGYETLDGHVVTTEIQGRRLAIGGTCAPWGPGIPDDAIPHADFSLLLSHTPDLVYKSARQGWDFILAGHNHAGQVRLPVVGPLLMPSLYSRRFEHGFFRVPPALMYVGQGVGCKHPIRYGCHPEIARFTLRCVPPVAPRARIARDRAVVEPIYQES
ncbi:metallophosphoesterase [Paludisphaera sp.]|uniref:metallophosphoesterase n=1 Tax=Paludisphaera sp. TaxID=2017432 RepID=UPI00301BCC61